MGKYVSYHKLPGVLEKEKSSGNKVVLTGGCFDLGINDGHRYLFKKAKENGDILVVNVVNDLRVKMYKGDSRPIFNEHKRARQVADLGFVDYSTVYPSAETGPTINLALTIHPDVIVSGADKPLSEEEMQHIKAILGYDVEFKLIPRSRYKSTTQTLEEITKRVST